MDFEIRPLQESEFPLWDGFVETSDEGALFHQSLWLKATGRKFLIYGYHKGGELFAGLPVVCHSKTVGMPPLTPYLGVVFKKRDTKYVNRISEEKEISQELARRLKQDFARVYFQFPPGNRDLQPFIWEGFMPGLRYTYVIDLSAGTEDIWQSMNDKRRNDIRKAEADGIEVIPCDDFEQVYNLVEKTFIRQEKTVTFREAACRYNEALKEARQCQGFLARNKQGEPMAAAYIAWDSRRSYYLLGGYDPEQSHHGASALAMWTAIKFAKEKLGLKEFDFEGSMVPPIEMFFRKFGGALTPYYTVSWRPSRLRLIPPPIKAFGSRILARLVR